MQQIFSGLYAITRASTNCFLLESAPDELTLIDTGMPGTTKTILKAVAELGYQAEQIKHILITHADLDHAGSVAKLAQITGADVYAGQKSVPYIESGTMPPHIPSFMQSVMNNFQKGTSVQKPFDDRDVLPIAGGILAIHVPGHTPENYNFFWEKESVLFAADLFFALTSDVTVSPAPISWDSNAVNASARKALELGPRYICPGHGQSVNIAQSPNRMASLRRKLGGGTTLAAT